MSITWIEKTYLVFRQRKLELLLLKSRLRRLVGFFRLNLGPSGVAANAVNFHDIRGLCVHGLLQSVLQMAVESL
jgi:hypothetical protein